MDLYKVLNAIKWITIGVFIGFFITIIVVSNQIGNIKTEIEKTYNYESLKDEIREDLYEDLEAELYSITSDEYSHLEESLTELIYDEIGHSIK